MQRHLNLYSNIFLVVFPQEGKVEKSVHRYLFQNNSKSFGIDEEILLFKWRVVLYLHSIELYIIM